MPKKAASLSESLFELAREKYEQVDLGNAGTSKMLMPDSSVIVAHRPTRYVLAFIMQAEKSSSACSCLSMGLVHVTRSR
ncbi:hypothetical protein SUGI_0132530 [Cryptomeria japonica]|nr:hypothetical protein SUGI_0132530 [Cryptomeria japonica]